MAGVEFRSRTDMFRLETTARRLIPGEILILSNKMDMARLRNSPRKRQYAHP